MRRMTGVLLGVIILGGCASPPRPEGCGCGETVQRTSLLRRLGLGRPKAETVSIENTPPDTYAATSPSAVETGPTPTAQPQPEKAQASAAAKPRDAMLRFAEFGVPEER